MSEYIFQSERLGFRRMTEGDLEVLARLNADPQVMEFFPSTLSFEESKAYLEKVDRHFEAHGFGRYAVDRLEEEVFIGFIGPAMTTFEAEFTPCVEMGWRLLPEFWGRGYATEGARRCLEYVFSSLGLEEIWAFTAIPNKRSEYIMQKLGMESMGDFDHPKLPESHWLRRHVLYRLLRVLD